MRKRKKRNKNNLSVSSGEINFFTNVLSDILDSEITKKCRPIDLYRYYAYKCFSCYKEQPEQNNFTDFLIEYLYTILCPEKSVIREFYSVTACESFLQFLGQDIAEKFLTHLTVEKGFYNADILISDEINTLSIRFITSLDNKKRSQQKKLQKYCKEEKGKNLVAYVCISSLPEEVLRNSFFEISAPTSSQVYIPLFQSSWLSVLNNKKSLTTWLYNAAQTLKNNDEANMWVMCGLAFLSLIESEENQKEIMEEISSNKHLNFLMLKMLSGEISEDQLAAFYNIGKTENKK